MNREQLRNLIIQTLLEVPGLYSEEAVRLIMGTGAQESHFEYIEQLGNGPALGFFQMEPDTFRDIIDNYLSYKPELLGRIIQVCNVKHLNAQCLQYNLKVAILFCRLHYYRKKGKLPATIEGMAAYWKKHYNTYLGKGTEQEFIDNYHRFVL